MERHVHFSNKCIYNWLVYEKDTFGKESRATTSIKNGPIEYREFSDTIDCACSNIFVISMKYTCSFCIHFQICLNITRQT